MNHKLHEKVGEIIEKYESNLDYKSIFDKDCNITSKPKQNIPLFSTYYKSNKTEYCNVDILILKEDKIKIIIEIDESDLKPTQICGKFLTSALSYYYIHESNNNIDNEIIGMDDFVLFLQIVDSSKINKDLSSKIIQWENIEESIQNIVPFANSNIKRYKLIYGNTTEPEILEKRIINQIEKCIPL